MAHEHQDTAKLYASCASWAARSSAPTPPTRDQLRPRDPEGSILEEALKIVTGPRNEDYGDPHENHGRTARMWSDYLGMVITPRQVCMMNILQKVSRDAHRPKRDNLVDIAGWAENASVVS